jgi:methylated-DNA-[protein]-cysteine S-methyltransferase
VRAYFAGEIRALEGLAADGGGTAFQRAGSGRSCGASRRVRREATARSRRGSGQAPHASRAVGVANARNPVALAVPCHRVIGADGSLTGYAAGVERKRWLLAHEGPLIRS